MLLNARKIVNLFLRESELSTFTFRAFGRLFYPKRLTESTFVEGDGNISLWYIKIRIEQVSSIPNCKANRKFHNC